MSMTKEQLKFMRSEINRLKLEAEDTVRASSTWGPGTQGKFLQQLDPTGYAKAKAAEAEARRLEKIHDAFYDKHRAACIEASRKHWAACTAKYEAINNVVRQLEIDLLFSDPSTIALSLADIAAKFDAITNPTTSNTTTKTTKQKGKVK